MSLAWKLMILLGAALTGHGMYREYGPAPGDVSPLNYTHIHRAPGLIEDLTAKLQENAWAGWRDPEYVLRYCPDALLPTPTINGQPTALFPYNATGFAIFIEVGMSLDKEGPGYLERLGQTNRRCKKDARYCARTEVRKDRLKDFTSRLKRHLKEASEMRACLNGQPGEGVAWDSLRGWCQHRNGTQE